VCEVCVQKHLEKKSKVLYIEKWAKYFFLGIRYKKNPKFFARVVKDANLFVVRLVPGSDVLFSLSLFFLWGVFRIKFFLSSSCCSVVQKQLEKKSEVLYIEKWPKCVLFVSRRHFLCIKKSNAWCFLDRDGFLRFWTPFFWSTVVAVLPLIYLCRCRKLGALHSTIVKRLACGGRLVDGRGEELHFAKLNPEKTRREKKLGCILDEDLSDLCRQKYATCFLRKISEAFWLHQNGVTRFFCGAPRIRIQKKLERKKENWSNEAVDTVSFLHARSQATHGS